MTGTETLERPETADKVEHFDVIIVGAGISGIGSAYHLQEQCPDKSFLVLETGHSLLQTYTLLVLIVSSDLLHNTVSQT